MTLGLGRLNDGESMQIEGYGKTWKASYHNRQSYGDDNYPVHGAFTGHYLVQHPDGHVSRHEHGPHATTEEAARRGANPSAKAYAADKAEEAITRGIFDAKMKQTDWGSIKH